MGLDTKDSQYCFCEMDTKWKCARINYWRKGPAQPQTQVFSISLIDRLQVVQNAAKPLTRSSKNVLGGTNLYFSWSLVIFSHLSGCFVLWSILWCSALERCYINKPTYLIIKYQDDCWIIFCPSTNSLFNSSFQVDSSQLTGFKGN